jgi:DNA invertase Pin-like site-specific DNA recombinase
VRLDIDISSTATTAVWRPVADSVIPSKSTDQSRRRGWSLVALDLGVDTTSPQGELTATVIASFAQYERRLIGVRTKEALAEKRAAGVVLGARARSLGGPSR